MGKEMKGEVGRERRSGEVEEKNEKEKGKDENEKKGRKNKYSDKGEDVTKYVEGSFPQDKANKKGNQKKRKEADK